MTEGYPIFQVFLARAAARKSKPPGSSGSPRFFFPFLFLFFPPFFLFFKGRAQQTIATRKEPPEVGHELFSVLRRVEKSSTNEESLDPRRILDEG